MLPANFNAERDLSWSTYEPELNRLLAVDLTPENVNDWLLAWTKLESTIDDLGNRVYVSKTMNTVDEAVKAAFEKYLTDTYPAQSRMNQALKEKLLASGIEPRDFAIPMRNMRSEAALFRPENVDLQSEEAQLSSQYGDIVGAQTVEWEGETVTLTKLDQKLQSSDRDLRERVWRTSMARRLADRPALNDLWTKLVDLRVKIASNAGYATYTDFRWEQLQRFDYTPANCETFHRAIEEVVIPAARRVNERRRERLGLSALRPWDLSCPTGDEQPLRPFENTEDMSAKARAILNHVDPELGEYYARMEREGLLDLPNRANKAPGGYCTAFPATRVPFIFMNAVGTHRDVQTLLHEAGHAFHSFESAKLPYFQQLNVNTEFAEVASMSMELLAASFLEKEFGGYYTPEEANRARVEHLEKLLLFWPYMAVVDCFQHWVYGNVSESRDPANCDRAWGQIWDRFMVGEDWSGLEAEKQTGWHRKLHIYEVPFYYVEYGLAQLGAVQVWKNSLADRKGAVAAYRSALALGGTVTLPEMFRRAGANFAFDADTMRQSVDLIEQKLEEYSA